MDNAPINTIRPNLTPKTSLVPGLNRGNEDASIVENVNILGMTANVISGKTKILFLKEVYGSILTPYLSLEQSPRYMSTDLIIRLTKLVAMV